MLTQSDLFEPSHHFFFSSRRRHTRSLCDWSSDVCSSDLSEFNLDGIYHSDRPGGDESQFWLQWKYFDENAPAVVKSTAGWRSEERRVGKECRSRGWPCH